MLNTQPGHDPREERREPEHEARAADDAHAPEHGPVVELLPVGEAVEARPRPQAEEPPHVGDTGRRRRAAAASSTSGPHSTPKSLLTKSRLPIRARWATNTPMSIMAADAVHDARAAWKPPSTRARRLAHGDVAEQQRQAGERQPEEAHHQHDVQPPVERVEAAIRASIARDLAPRPDPSAASHSTVCRPKKANTPMSSTSMNLRRVVQRAGCARGRAGRRAGRTGRSWRSRPRGTRRRSATRLRRRHRRRADRLAGRCRARRGSRRTPRRGRIRAPSPGRGTCRGRCASTRRGRCRIRA